MFVGVARYDLRLLDSASLKDKRAVLRSVTAAVHKKFRCSVAEVDHQDLHQRATLGIALVSGTHFQARKVLQQVGRVIEAQPGIELLGALEDVLSQEDR